MIQIKVASLEKFDLKVELLEDLLFFPDVETCNGLEEWAFCEFGIVGVFEFSAVWKWVNVFGIAFPCDRALIDSGWLVGHEEVAFV